MRQVTSLKTLCRIWLVRVCVCLCFVSSRVLTASLWRLLFLLENFWAFFLFNATRVVAGLPEHQWVEITMRCLMEGRI